MPAAFTTDAGRLTFPRMVAGPAPIHNLAIAEWKGYRPLISIVLPAASAPMGGHKVVLVKQLSIWQSIAPAEERNDRFRLDGTKPPLAFPMRMARFADSRAADSDRTEAVLRFRDREAGAFV